MTIKEYFGDWSKVVDLSEADRVMKILSAMNKPICPKLPNVFKAFRLCSLSSLRVIILGQDCYSDYYEGEPRATGIAFANKKDTPIEKYSPSLDVLRMSLIDFSIPHNEIIFDCCLEKWEEQGVLMLNSALSCQQGKPGSHSLLWRPFTKSLLTNLSKNLTGIVYVLMGASAISFKNCIDERFNHIIEINHPSMYARIKQEMPSYWWKETNEILVGQNGYGIQWYEEVV